MNTFKKLVTNVSTGAAPVSRLKFYTKRLAQETATRRIATILMIGLLLFQVAVFIFPPQTTRASAGDIISGGIAGNPPSNQAVLDTFKSSGAVQLVYQAGISDQNVLDAQPSVQFCKSSNLLSMGRLPDPTGQSWLYPQHSDIYVGPSTSRWNSQCIEGMKGKNKIFADIGQGGAHWYEWGILYNCGNMVFIPTTPPVQPQTITCTSLNAAPTAVDINQPITLTGNAHGENVSAGDLTDMAYLVYQGTNISVNTNQVFQRLDSKGIAPNAGGDYTDSNPKQFKTDQAGTYTILLAVAYDSGTKLAAGSGAGACQQVVTVKPSTQPSIVCQNLNVNPTTQTGGQPITMTGTAKQVDENNPNELADFTYYIRQKNANGSYSDTTVDAKGHHSIDAYGMLPNSSGVYTDTRPPASNPNDTFFMPANTTGQPQTYQIFLRVFWRGHVPVSDAFSVPACAKEVTVPPMTTPFVCENLQADKSNGPVPLAVNFKATGAATNTTIQGFDFDFGDSAKQSVNTNQTTASTGHTYTKGGKYTASVVMRTAAGTTPATPACTVVITVNDTGFAKVVANLTLLTSGGQPTDANGPVARAGDKLRYTIGVENKGGEVVKAFVFDDDITDILQYATVIDAGGAKTVTTGAVTKLIWDPIDIPVASGGQASTITKQFTVQLKNPIPFVAQKNTDVPGSNDCQLTDVFHGVTVNTPLGVDINKQIECTVQKLPQTGANSGWVIFLMAFFAAASLFLLFRNRLLKRELELVETLTEGAA